MIGLTVYLICTFLVGAIVQALQNKQAKEIYLATVFLVAFAVSALRGESVGLDTRSTLQIFERISANGLSEIPRNTEIEKGYMVLCYILSKIINHSQIITVITSAFICYSFYYIIKKYSYNYMISSLVFVSCIFTVTMNVSRQYLALAFVLFSIPFALDKKPIKTILLILIACAMHYSALVFLPIWVLSFPKYTFTRKKLALIGGISILAIPFYMTLVSLVTTVFSQYERFLYSSRYSASSEVAIGFVIFLLLILIIDLWGIIPVEIKGSKLIISGNERIRGERDEHYEYNKNEVMNYLFTLFFIEYIVIYFISTKLWIAGRLIYYFQMSLVIVLPNMIYRLKYVKQQKILSIIVAIVIISYYLNFGYNYYINDPHGVLPYKIFWQ